jgi:hypothetical protein
MELQTGDYVKVLKNSEFFKIVQIKHIYGNTIETTHGSYQRDTLANRLDGRCIISGLVKWEDLE